jgi:hypothetical protein
VANISEDDSGADISRPMKTSGMFYYLKNVSQAQKISHYRKLLSARLNAEIVSK